MDSPTSPTEQLLGEVAFVHRLARALLRDAGQAHDVAQDALAAALQEGPVHHVRGWLAAVTRHLAGRTRREARQRMAREARAARPPAHDGEERTAERLRLHRRLTDAVMALPEPYRTAVTLRFFDQLSPRAIAQRLRLPAPTVRQHLHRGLLMLRQQLDGEFGGRDRWQAAFAAVALGKAAVPVLLWIPVLAMKKVAVALLVLAVAAGWWALDRDGPPPVPTTMASAAVGTAATATRAGSENAPPANARAALPTATVPSALFVVRVVDEREQPIAGADVHRWTASGDAEQQRTDGDGRVEFAPRDGSGGLLVRAAGHAPFLRELDRLRGELRCLLPDGFVLDGTMLVDGAPAPAGLRLGAETGAAAPASAPRAIHDLLGAYRQPGFAVTSAAGAFSLRGLDATQAVTLVTPQTHWLLPEDGLIERDNHRRRTLLPARGVLLRTTQLPTVYGRVVWADDGSPVPSARLMVYARFADSENSPSMGCSGEQDGTFAVGLYPGAHNLRLRWMDPSKRSPMIAVVLSAEAEGSDGSLRVDLDPAALARMPLELRLPRAALTHFVVTDQDGRPIAGARVSATPSTATDEHGRGTFQGPRDKVLVGADGHQVQPARPVLPAAGTAADPLHFRLAPNNRLVIDLRRPDGAVPPIRFVRIESPADLFCGKRFQGDFDRTFGGSEGSCSRTWRNLPDGSTAWHRWTCTVTPDAAGRIDLHSLEPDLACTATAVAALDTVVARVAFVTPPAGGTTTAALVVSDVARSVRGRVQARDGTPIPNATVELSNDEQQAETRVDAAGAFAFDCIYGDESLELLAKSAGYASVRSQWTAANAASEQVLVLERGMRVTLRIVDDTDQLIPAVARAEVSAVEYSHGQMLQPGEHQWTDLPAGLVTFRCFFANRSFTLEHDTRNPNAVLRVPRPARILVAKPSSWDREQAPGTSLAARATRLDAAGEPVWLSVGMGEADADLLLPGRYRFELLRRTWHGEGDTRRLVDEIAAPAQEIDVKAGELVRLKF